MMTRSRNLLLTAGAAVLTMAMAKPAEAVTILVFGQTGLTQTISGTQNGAQTATTIAGTDVQIFITAIENGAPTLAFLTLSATSTNAAVNNAGNVTQNYAGTFTITSGAGGTGTNFLSGSFTDSTFGAAGGSGLTMQAAQPPDTVSFTSSVITSLNLGRNISLSFTNVIPAVGICGTTLCSFAASVGGNFSANIGTQVPEPGSIVLLGAGLVGLAAAVRRRTRKA